MFFGNPKGNSGLPYGTTFNRALVSILLLFSGWFAHAGPNSEIIVTRDACARTPRDHR